MHPARFWTLFILVAALATVFVCTLGHAAPPCKVPCADTAGPCIITVLPGNIFFYDYPPKQKIPGKKLVQRFVVKIGKPYLEERRLPNVAKRSRTKPLRVK